MSLHDRAKELDTADPLGGYRERFVISDDLIYLDGNSLGRLPVTTADRVDAIVRDEWAHELVMGWDRWLDIGLEIGSRLAPLIGAKPTEVAVCDQTSINLFKLATAGLRASGRTNVITDTGNFPSDRYILEHVARVAGGTARFAPEDPTPADVAALLDESVGLVSLSHVGYRSGTILDVRTITDLAHDAGAMVLWDLAHSAGALPVDLDEWDVDLAVGCTYKYLNAGPGAPGYLFVREDLITNLEPSIPGWYAHADQFAMAQQFVPKDTIGRFVVGTPPVISMVAVDEGIGLSVEAGIDRIREKSLALTDFFIGALTAGENDFAPFGLTVVTPLEHERRGSQVTIRHPEAYRISLALREAGVIPDFRAPDLVRFGFTPLYTSFADVARATEILHDVLANERYTQFNAARSGVT